MTEFTLPLSEEEINSIIDNEYITLTPECPQILTGGGIFSETLIKKFEEFKIKFTEACKIRSNKVRNSAYERTPTVPIATAPNSGSSTLPLNALPNDMIGEIIGRLSKDDLTNILKVSKSMRPFASKVIQNIKTQEQNIVKTNVDLIVQTIKGWPNSFNSDDEVINNITIYYTHKENVTDKYSDVQIDIFKERMDIVILSNDLYNKINMSLRTYLKNIGFIFNTAICGNLKINNDDKYSEALKHIILHLHKNNFNLNSVSYIKNTIPKKLDFFNTQDNTQDNTQNLNEKEEQAKWDKMKELLTEKPSEEYNVTFHNTIAPTQVTVTFNEPNPASGGSRKKDAYKRTLRKHVGKDGKTRIVYEKNGKYYVKKRDAKKGKFVYKVVS